MKRVIALIGNGKKGKSQTIIKVFDLLRAKYRNAKIEHLAKSYGADIKVLLTIDGVRIGIESQGDPGGKVRPGRLRPSLTQFWQIPCEVIVCAARPFGDTHDAVKELAPTYEIVFIDQDDAGKSKPKQEAANRKKAQEIVAEIEDLLP
jgi:hypothetical protein